MATKKKDIPDPPGYCTTAVLANLFDTTAQWIGELTKSGVLVKRKTEAGSRYNIVECTRAYVKHLRDKAAGRSGESSDEEKKKLAAEVRIKEAKAAKAELELQELQLIMHRSEDVSKMTEQLVFTIRSMLIALPGRLAVDVSAVDTAAEASVIIRREVNAVLSVLAGFKYDPADYERMVAEREKWAEQDIDEDV